MAGPEALLQDAATFATRAVQYDQAGLSDTAIFYYTVIVYRMKFDKTSLFCPWNNDHQLYRNLCQGV